MDCLVDNNLYSLVIEGKPTDQELLTAWEQIKIQYADAVKGGEYLLYRNLKNEVGVLSFRLTQIEMLIDALKIFYEKHFADLLNKILRSSFAFDVLNNEQYEKDLKGAWRRSRGTKISLDLKKMALEKMETKESGESAKPTREYFYGILITLSDHAKYPIEETITTWKFCERIRRVNEYAEREKLKTIKRK